MPEGINPRALGLRARGLCARADAAGRNTLLHGIDLDVAAGERLGVVGPSGAGKSMLLRALAGFTPAGIEVSGSVRLIEGRGEGFELMGLPRRRRHRLVTSRLAILWQDSLRSLNPYRTVGAQLSTTLRLHHPQLRGRALSETCTQWLGRAGLLDEGILRRYPHQLSGGMRQRVAITLSLCGPQQMVLVDEPTTALDMVRQKECIGLLGELSRGLGRTMIYVSHDLALTAALCTRVVVVAGGRVVEQGRVEEVFGAPISPVTRRLVENTREVRPA